MKKEDLFELAEGTISKQLLGRYQHALERLKPFNISEKAKKSLFISMLLEVFHDKER